MMTELSLRDSSLLLCIRLVGLSKPICKVLAHKKKDVRFSVCSTELGGAQRRVCLMIISRGSQETCVTCDEPFAKWPKGSTGDVRYDRHSSTSLQTLLL